MTKQGMAREECHKCNKHFLLWEMLPAGIRVKREREGKFYYSAMCPQCGDYEIEATNA